MEIPTVIFLHGAGMGRWIWAKVQDGLGVPSFAFDINSRHAAATPRTCASELVAQIDTHKINDVVLVSHSLAGVLVPSLGALLSERLKGCVYVAAVLPKTGKSFAQSMGFGPNIILNVLFAFNRNGLKPSEKMLRAELCNDLAPEDSSKIVERFVPEHAGLFLTAVDQSYPDVPSLYVKLAEDRSVSPDLQRVFSDRIANVKVDELQSGHMPMFSVPARLAEAIATHSALQSKR
jgi:pimeloyl-ACP methyl ester carboxylesterase